MFVTRICFLSIDLWLLNSGILLLPLFKWVLTCHIELYINNTFESKCLLHDLVDIDTDGRDKTKIYYKRYDFNFQFLSRNISSAPSHSVYLSQLVRFARGCTHMDFENGDVSIRRLPQSSFCMRKNDWNLHKFYSHHNELVDQFNLSVCQLTNGILDLWIPKQSYNL